jgi:hypothetical protein
MPTAETIDGGEQLLFVEELGYECSSGNGRSEAARAGVAWSVGEYRQLDHANPVKRR